MEVAFSVLKKIIPVLCIFRFTLPSGKSSKVGTFELSCSHSACVEVVPPVAHHHACLSTSRLELPLVFERVHLAFEFQREANDREVS